MLLLISMLKAATLDQSPPHQNQGKKRGKVLILRHTGNVVQQQSITSLFIISVLQTRACTLKEALKQVRDHSIGKAASQLKCCDPAAYAISIISLTLLYLTLRQMRTEDILYRLFFIRLRKFPYVPS